MFCLHRLVLNLSVNRLKCSKAQKVPSEWEKSTTQISQVSSSTHISFSVLIEAFSRSKMVFNFNVNASFKESPPPASCKPHSDVSKELDSPEV